MSSHWLLTRDGNGSRRDGRYSFCNVQQLFCRKVGVTYPKRIFPTAYLHAMVSFYSCFRREILLCSGHETNLIWYNGRVGCNARKRTLQRHMVAPHSAFCDAFRREQKQCSMKLRHVTKRSQCLSDELGRCNMNTGRRKKHSSARERSAMFMHLKEQAVEVEETREFEKHAPFIRWTCRTRVTIT
jgi:hypothetical protein